MLWHINFMNEFYMNIYIWVHKHAIVFIDTKFLRVDIWDLHFAVKHLTHLVQISHPSQAVQFLNVWSILRFAGTNFSSLRWRKFWRVIFEALCSSGRETKSLIVNNFGGICWGTFTLLTSITNISLQYLSVHLRSERIKDRQESVSLSFSQSVNWSARTSIQIPS